jgi:hypothetical protein
MNVRLIYYFACGQNLPRSVTDTVLDATSRCKYEKRGEDWMTISLTLLQTFELTIVSDHLTFDAGYIALHAGRD